MLIAQGHVYTSIAGYSEKETSNIFSELLHVLCTPMTIGTHYEGTSTNDITFWVLHPTFDRLVCVRVILIFTNDVTFTIDASRKGGENQGIKQNKKTHALIIVYRFGGRLHATLMCILIPLLQAVASPKTDGRPESRLHLTLSCIAYM